MQNKIQILFEKLREFYTMRGKSYQKLLKFDEAVQDFTSLIDNEMINCNNRKSIAQSLILRAMSYEAVGNKEKAKNDFEKAIESSVN